MNNYRLSMNNIVEYNGFYYFLSIFGNCIIKMNLDMSKCRVVARIPRTMRIQYSEILPQYEGIYSYKDKLIFLPDLADRIVIYDLIDNELRYIDYPNSNELYTPFMGGILHEGYLYIFPTSHDKIFKLDIVNEKLHEVKINMKINRLNNTCAWGALTYHDNYVTFTAMQKNKIYRFSLNTEAIEDVTPAELNEELSGIVYCDGKYWVFPKKCDRILVLDDNYRFISERIIDVKEYKSDVWSFSKIIAIDPYLYLLPRRSNAFIRYDVEWDIFEIINMGKLDTEGNRLDRFMPISNVWENNGNTYFAHSSSGKIFKINGDKIEEHQIKLTERITSSYCNVVICENDEFDQLSDFITYLKLT